jgi:hypothetical protein
MAITFPVQATGRSRKMTVSWNVTAATQLTYDVGYIFVIWQSGDPPPTGASPSGPGAQPDLNDPNGLNRKGTGGIRAQGRLIFTAGRGFGSDADETERFVKIAPAF